MSMLQTSKRHSVRCSANAACWRKVFIMIHLALRSIALAPVQLAWLRAAALLPATLARRRRRAYASDIPEKEGNGFDSLNTSKRTDRVTRFFFVCMLLRVSYERRWRGGLRACWFPLVYQSVNPTTCRSPRLTAGRGVTTHQGGSHA